MPATLTLEQFIEKARQAHGDKYDYSKVNYVRNSTPVTIVCPVHGDFQQRPADHIAILKSGKGKGCSKCKPHPPLTHDEWLQKAISIHGDKYDYSQTVYTGSKKMVIIRCKAHDKCFEQLATTHVGKSANGCPTCGFDRTAAAKRKDIEHFIKRARKVHGDKYDYSKAVYVNRNEPITIICPAHGAFKQSPFNHYQGKGCSVCRLPQGERKVAMYLDYLNIEYELQKRFEGCRHIFQLPFDFYIPEYDALIEFDGAQHFRPVDVFGGEEGFRKLCINDAIKNRFAEETGRPILRIRYDEDVESRIDSFIFDMIEEGRGYTVAPSVKC